MVLVKRACISGFQPLPDCPSAAPALQCTIQCMMSAQPLIPPPCCSLHCIHLAMCRPSWCQQGPALSKRTKLGQGHAGVKVGDGRGSAGGTPDWCSAWLLTLRYPPPVPLLWQMLRSRVDGVEDTRSPPEREQMSHASPLTPLKR